MSVNAQIEVILFGEILQSLRAHKLILFAVSVFEIEVVETELVRHNYIVIVRHSSCHPIVSADSFEPPNFIFILKCDSVHFICSVLFKKCAESFDTFSCGVDVWKSDCNHIFFADSAESFFDITVFARFSDSLYIFYKRIRRKHSFICCKRFGCSHRNILFVNAESPPNSFVFYRIRHTCVSHRIVRQIDFNF